MIRALRVIVGSAATLYLLAGPAVPQIFGGAKRWWPAWQMFTAFGVDLCTVALTDGVTGEPIERLSALGYDHLWDAPSGERTLKDPAAVSRQVKSICKKGGLEDVRADVFCAVERGWVHVATGKENACIASATELVEGHDTKRPYKKQKKQP